MDFHPKDCMELVACGLILWKIAKHYFKNLSLIQVLLSEKLLICNGKICNGKFDLGLTKGAFGVLRVFSRANVGNYLHTFILEKETPHTEVDPGKLNERTL